METIFVWKDAATQREYRFVISLDARNTPCINGEHLKINNDSADWDSIRDGTFDAFSELSTDGVISWPSSPGDLPLLLALDGAIWRMLRFNQAPNVGHHYRYSFGSLRCGGIACDTAFGMPTTGSGCDGFDGNGMLRTMIRWCNGWRPQMHARCTTLQFQTRTTVFLLALRRVAPALNADLRVTLIQHLARAERWRIYDVDDDVVAYPLYKISSGSRCIHNSVCKAVKAMKATLDTMIRVSPDDLSDRCKFCFS